MAHRKVAPSGVRSHTVVLVARRALIVVLFVAAAMLGTLGGVLFAYSTDLPDFSRLDDYRPNTITRLLARDGEEVKAFATERRVVVGYDDIAPVLRQAIVATEDGRFEEHFGLNVGRILVSQVRGLFYDGAGGASTITQQLARDQFLTEYRRGGVFVASGLLGYERKLKEMFIAVQMERHYTKREIFTFYANQINFHGAYGVEAAARMYFDTSARDVTLEEAATLAAIIQTPARLSPFVNPDLTRRRRDTVVLQRMLAEGFITPEEARSARERPIELRGRSTEDPSIAPYFAEEIRKTLEADYGVEALYGAGLTVQTTLDAPLQTAANRALDRGLRRIDKARGEYRRPARNLVVEGESLDGFSTDRWTRAIVAGDIVPAIVTAVASGSPGRARLRIGAHHVELPPAAFAWTRRPAERLFRVGDLIDVEVRALDAGRPRSLVLEQTPELEGAVIAIDNRSGQIRAMAGGFSFTRSKFNRATQAQRQVGSLFKPIVYTAAIDRGFTPVSIFIDEPVSFEPGPNQPLYEPLNYDRAFLGPVTLRTALEDSRNIPAVKAMYEIGPAEVVSYAARFGLPGDYPPYLSLALGSAESSLVDITSAYTAFPNQGIRMVPYSVVSIADRDGNVLEEHGPQPREAIRADTAFIMTNLLRGVVQHGTAAAAASLNWPVAGKTGTMDEYTDAWFVGFDPLLTVGVWVGFDEKKPIGSNQTGAAAALPIWMDVMRAHIEAHGDRENLPEFEAPGNIVFVTLDNGITEAFINGTQPQDGMGPLFSPPLQPPAPGPAGAQAPAPALPVSAAVPQ
jgi:penicillin-binding protein 1A